jgi:integrase
MLSKLLAVAANSVSKADRKGRAIQPDHAQRLFEQCEANTDENRQANEDLRLVILLGLLAGLRRGEMFALDWPSIDWEGNLIHVQRNLFWRHGQPTYSMKTNRHL